MSSNTPKIVILYAGVAINPFLRSLINLRINCTIIANTLSDFKVESSSKDSKEKKSGGWIQLELISLASAILPDDLTKSPLASLFSMSKMINIIPLSPSEQFLAAWFSELRGSDPKKAPDSIHELFRTLTNYNSLPIEVYPLSLAMEEPITIKYRNQSGPPRAYQKFGFLNFEKPVTIEPEDLKAAITKEKDFSMQNFDPKQSIIPAEVEKMFREADAIIISAYDFPSLVTMLSYKDVRKSIKKTNGTVLAVSPLGERLPLHSPREEILLQMFGIKPDMEGFMELLLDVADVLVIDEGDSEISSNAQETGFNVVVGDLTMSTESQNEFMGLVIKAAGLDIDSVQIVLENPEDAIPPPSALKKLEEEIKQVSGLSSRAFHEIKNNDDQAEAPLANIPDKKSHSANSSITYNNNQKTLKSDPITENTIMENSDVTKGSITESMASLSSHATISSSSKHIAIKDSFDLQESMKTNGTQITDENETQKGSKIQNKASPDTSKEDGSIGKSEDFASVSKSEIIDSEIKGKTDDESLTLREAISHSIKEIEEDKVSDLDHWVEEIQDKIEQDENLEVHTAQGLIKLISGVFTEKVRNKALKVFMKLTEDREITFRRALQSWLVSELNNPDLGIQDQQSSTLTKMANVNKDFVGKVLESYGVSLLTSDLVPSQLERGRSVMLRIAFTSKLLSRYVIKSYLSLYDDEKVNKSNLWTTLSSYDARLVAIEILEANTVEKSQKIAEEVVKRDLGSFSVLLHEIINYWAEGDIDRVLSICGTLSDSALRKARRINLAGNIKKIGTIPLETLARSLKEDPKELEALVYEMVMNDEISARLEIVDGRLYIIQIDNGDE